MRHDEGKLLVASMPGISVVINALESWWSSGDEREYGTLKHEAAFPKKKGVTPVANDRQSGQIKCNTLATF
jgi:hypothetical protein